MGNEITVDIVTAVHNCRVNHSQKLRIGSVSTVGLHINRSLKFTRLKQRLHNNNVITQELPTFVHTSKPLHPVQNHRYLSGCKALTVLYALLVDPYLNRLLDNSSYDSEELNCPNIAVSYRVHSIEHVCNIFGAPTLRDWTEEK
jgi:hypothetical protein